MTDTNKPYTIIETADPLKHAPALALPSTKPIAAAHAEMIALTQASETLSQMPEAKPAGGKDHRGSLEGATLYVTLEPCPMCAGALVMTKCTNLVYGARDAKAGACHSLFHITDDDRLNHRVKVTGGVMADDAKFLLSEFFKNLRKEKR